MIRIFNHSDFILAAKSAETEFNARGAYSDVYTKHYCYSYTLELWVNSSFLYRSSLWYSELRSLKDVGIFYTSREKKFEQCENDFYAKFVSVKSENLSKQLLLFSLRLQPLGFESVFVLFKLPFLLLFM